jgi:hypothetical protein
MTTWLLSFVLLTTTAVPQQSLPHPPDPSADNAPSLEVTMKFIQDGILGQHTYAGEYRAVQADASHCTLSWTTVDTHDKSPLFTEQKVSFNDIAKLEVAYDEVAANWNLELYAAVGKTVTVHLYAQKKDDPCEHCKKKVEKRFERSRWFIYFTGEEIANREAKAMLHAAELCGGGKKSSF